MTKLIMVFRESADSIIGHAKLDHPLFSSVLYERGRKEYPKFQE